ncbi:hypothetical protein OKA05_19040 [Luteolibacter arcticus]|uniref:DUF4239 domain-containing protein n=1 Tax=Luteolibacter arcticus TaxID=1581411 RepID=A0ABT3GMD7_9BACT|nr:hypothetical protein [Luteolibacter arcticus]MCW1924669.1 hypothetical protein [Luteolibacter arcticus]
MFRKLLIALHLAGAALSVALFVSTFVAKGVITSKARAAAIEKSRGASDPLATRLQETLERPVLGKLIRGKVRERLESELADYRAAPEDWLGRLAEGGAERAKAFDFPEIDHPLARKAVDSLISGVSDLRRRLEDSYRSLIFDLRLFAATNLVAFVLAAFLARVAATPRARHWLLGYSFVMLLAFAASIFLYVDQNWTWNILRNNHMGWGYPAVLGVITLYGIIRITPELFLSRPPASTHPGES